MLKSTSRIYILPTLLFCITWLLTPCISLAYNDIGLTTVEKQWIKQNPVVKIGYDANWIPFEWHDFRNGFAGLSAEYVQYVEEVTDLKFELNRYDQWNTLFNELKQGNIDMISATFHTNERTKHFNFTDPYYYVPQIYVQDRNAPISPEESLNYYTVGYTKGYLIGEKLAEFYPNLRLIEYELANEGLNALSKHKIDAYAGSKHTLAHIISMMELEELEIGGDFEKIFPLELCMASIKDQPILNSILNKAVNTIPQDRLLGIYSQWLMSESLLPKKLNIAEKEWLSSQSDINCYIGQDPPFHYWDEGPQGIIVDILNYIADQHGFKVNYIEYPYMSDISNKLINQDKASIFPCNNKNSLYNDFEYTSTIISEPLVIFANKRTHDIFSVKDLKHKTVAAVNSYQQQKELSFLDSTVNIKSYPTIHDCIEALNKAEVDAYLGNTYEVRHYSLNHLMYNIKMVAPVRNISHNYSLAVSNEYQILASIINKSLSSLTEEQMDSFYVNYQPKLSNYQQLKAISVIALVLFLLIILWNWQLLRMVASRTKKLKAYGDELEEKVEQAIDKQFRTARIIMDAIEENIFVIDTASKELVYSNEIFTHQLKEGLVGLHDVFENHTPDELYQPLGSQYKYSRKYVKWPDGRLLQFVMAVDISRQKLEEVNLSVTLNSISDAIIATDLNARITRMNPIAERLTAWGFEQAKGLNISEVFQFYDNKTQQLIENPVLDVLRTNSTHEKLEDSLLISKDGHKFHIATGAAPIRINDSEIIGAILNFRDVSYSFKVKQELEQKEHIAEVAHQLSGSGSWYIDYKEDFQKFYVSDTVVTLLGEEQFITQGYVYRDYWKSNILNTNSEVAEQALNLLRHELANHSDRITGEWLYTRPSNGEQVWIKVKIEVIRDEQDAITYIYGALIDITEEKERQTRAEEQIARQKAIQEQALFGAWHIDYVKSPKLIHLDAKLTEMHGNNTDESYIGHQVFYNNILSSNPENGHEIAEYILKASQDPNISIFDTEYKYTRPHDGELIWVKSKAICRRNSKGKIEYIHGVAQDITTIKKQEQQIAESEQRLRTTLLASNTGMWEYDINNKNLIVDDIALTMRGYNAEDKYLLSSIDSILEITHPDEVNNLKVEIDDFFSENNNEYRSERQERCADGSYKWIDSIGSVVKRNEDGSPALIMGIYRDVTENKKQVNTLIQYKKAIESSGEAIVFTNVEGIIEFVNNAFLLMSGYESAELLGKHISIVYYNNYKAFNIIKINQETKNTWRGEILMLHKDGSTRPVHLSADPVKDDNGNIIGLIGVRRDLSESKRKQQEIIYQKELSQILTNISTRYINVDSKDLSYSINNALKDIGEHIHADRVNVLSYDFESNRFRSIYEWCNEGVTSKAAISRKNNKTQISLEHFEAALELHKKGEFYIVENVGLLTNNAQKNIIERYGIKSVATVPMFLDGQLIGCIGFDICSEARTFKSSELSLLQVFSEILSSLQKRNNDENEKLEKHQFLQTLLNSMPDFVFAKDLNGNYTSVNQSFERFAGSQLEDILGKNDYDLFDKYNAQKFQEEDKVVINNNKPSIIEEVQTYKGEPIILETIKLPLQNAEGKTIGILGIAHDFTERKKQEVALIKQKEFSELLAHISSDYVNIAINKIDDGINNALIEIGEHIHADRAYVFEYDLEKLECNNSYEWCADGISSEKEGLQHIPLHEIGPVLDCHKSKNAFVVDDVNSLEDNPTRAHLERQNIISMIAIPYFLNGELGGFIGFDFVKTPHIFDTDELSLFKVFSEIISNIKQKEAYENEKYEHTTLLQLLMDTVPHYIYAKDINGAYTLVNKQVELLLGKSSQDIIGKTDDNLFNNETINTFNQNNKVLYEVGETITSEDWLTINNQQIYLETTQTPLRNAQDETIGFVALSMDTTKSKQEKDHIKQAQENIEIILNNVPIGVAIINLEEREFLFMNTTMRQMLELEDHEVRNFDDSSVYSDKNSYELLLKEIDKNNGLYSKEMHYIRSKSKESFWAQVSVQRSYFFNKRASLITLYDINESKLVHEKTSKSQANLERILDTIPIGLVIRNRHGNKNVLMNATMRHMIELDEDITTDFSPEDLFNNENIIHYLNAEEDAMDLDMKYTTLKTKREFWAQTSIFQREYFGRECTLMCIYDSTSMKEMQLNLQLAKDKADEANMAKSTFLANMSHEIRTPMNAIMGFAELLHRKLKDGSDSSYTQAIKTSGESLLSLINNILDLSKIEAGKMEVYLQETNLSHFMSELDLLFRGSAQRKTLLFDTILNEDTPSIIMMDQVKLRQICINLIGNAIKFTKEGYVTIHGETIIQSDTELTLRISVSDSGIGIAPDKTNIIFDEFTQEDGSTTRKYGGTGLGLSISSNLVKMLGGTITVDSALGQGATFTLEIPKIRYLNHTDDSFLQEEVDEEIQFEQSTILVVDDNESNRSLMKSYLSEWSLDTYFAVSGIEAINKSIVLMPDLILIDIRMPGDIDGFDASLAIKQNPKTMHIPIIACTASLFNMTQNELEDKKLSGILHKPVLRKHIINELKKHINYIDLATQPSVDGLEAKELLILSNDELAILQPFWLECEATASNKNRLLFADKMKNIGLENDNAGLMNLGVTLEKSINSFNIEKIDKTINYIKTILMRNN